MKILGVTGGMGSGKSTVAAYLKDKGAAVIDCDVLAKEVLETHEVISQVKKEFGNGVIAKNGIPDRKKLANIVFQDTDKLKKLNEITHKHIVEKLMCQIENYKKDKNVSLVVIDAAIPIRKGFMDVTDEIWTVVADKSLRIKRVMERSGLSYEQALNRVNSQMSDQEYVDVADKIIMNNEDLYELKIEVAEMLLNISK